MFRGITILGTRPQPDEADDTEGSMTVLFADTAIGEC